MKIGKFSVPENKFKTIQYLINKFDYNVPVQIVGAVSAGASGLYYLCIKHHQVEGSANFEWFNLNRFQFFIPTNMIDLETLRKNDKDDNPYYWIHETVVQIFKSTKANQSSLSSAVLIKFEEDDDEIRIL